MTIARLREVLLNAILTDLQRALAAIYMTWVFQALVLLIGMARVGGLDQTRMPAWPHITPETLRAMQDDPMWWGWGRHHVSPALSRAGRPMGLAVAGLGLLMVPGMLAAVERYCDRLERLTHAVHHGRLGQQTGSNRPAEKPKEAREDRG